MIHDGAPHRVFNISELARVIAHQLILISQESAVNLACASRCLEEPVLSTLWETQHSLSILLEVLPEGTWDRQYPEPRVTVLRIVGDPQPEAWNRVHRYASWMHQLCVSDWLGIGEDTSRILRLNSPAGGWFPALRDLSWCIASHNLPYVDLSFSPHLEKISISLSFPWFTYGTPREVLTTIASAISALPASALQLLLVDCGRRKMPWTHLKDSFSSVALRCGPSLTEFASPVALSDAAVNHLIQLPNLRALRVKGPPPGYYTPSPPPVFPPLVEFTLGEHTAHGWLSLFERLEDRVSPTQDTTPLSKLKGSLKFLKVETLPGLIVGAPLTSPIRIFRNLVDLNVEALCLLYGEGPCGFRLNNIDVAELAKALPRLESFLLGYPCGENTCVTTVACLVSISIHCVKLRRLEVHFNTTNIVDDLKNILADPPFQQLRSLPRCTLTCLDTHQIPLILDGSDLETVVHGMISIFPSLEYCLGYEGIWDEISDRIEEIRKHSTLQANH